MVIGLLFQILKISSLLGYCHYQLHNFSEAANHFERIWTTAGSDQVATWLVHCLASDGRIHEANRVLSCINNPERREALELRVALQIKAKNFKEVKVSHKHSNASIFGDLNDNFQ